MKHTSESLPSDPAQFGAAEKRYEWRIVLLLSLTFGLVGLDRWILPPLFPAMMGDLQLDYDDLGALVGILGLSWGVCAILFGKLSDRFGRRKILIPAVVAFSIMSVFSGLAGGLAMMLMVRGLMGVAEGAFTPVATAAAAEGSHPNRRGLNQGIMMSTFALLGFGLAPIVATQMLEALSSWRAVFMLVGLPGLLLAFILWRFLREPEHLKQGGRAERPLGWREVSASHNIRIATGLTFCTMSCVMVFGTMGPSYLTDHLGLETVTMGFIMSAMGFGGFLGEIAVPGISDLIGRKPASILAFVLSLASVWIFMNTGSDPLQLFLALGAVAFFSIGLIALLTGPVSTEAVPAHGISTAIGLVSGLGEIFGGAVAPFIAGIVAVQAGIDMVFWVPIVGLALGAVLSPLLQETAPRKVRDII